MIEKEPFSPSEETRRADPLASVKDAALRAAHKEMERLLDENRRLQATLEERTRELQIVKLNLGSVMAYCQSHHVPGREAALGSSPADNLQSTTTTTTLRAEAGSADSESLLPQRPEGVVTTSAPEEPPLVVCACPSCNGAKEPQLCVCESVYWNPYNAVTQCHRCGQVFTGTASDAWQGSSPADKEQK